MKTGERPARYRRRPDVVSRQVAGETVLVPIRGTVAELQSIHLTNPVGGFILELLDGSRTLEDVRAALLERYDAAPARIDADLEEFVSRALAAGVIEVVTG